jgi:hypothetical protein
LARDHRQVSQNRSPKLTVTRAKEGSSVIRPICARFGFHVGIVRVVTWIIKHSRSSRIAWRVRPTLPVNTPGESRPQARLLRLLALQTPRSSSCLTCQTILPAKMCPDTHAVQRFASPTGCCTAFRMTNSSGTSLAFCQPFRLHSALGLMSLSAITESVL